MTRSTGRGRRRRCAGAATTRPTSPKNLRYVDLQLRTASGIPPAEDPGSAPGCVLEYGIHEMTLRLHDILDGLKISHALKTDYVANCHTIPLFEAEITDSLPAFKRVFAHPRPVPERFTYLSMEPKFDVWGWHVEADPARALEFLRMQDAGRSGVTLVGSGKTLVTTPPVFADASSVDVVSDGKALN